MKYNIGDRLVILGGSATQEYFTVYGYTSTSYVMVDSQAPGIYRDYPFASVENTSWVKWIVGQPYPTKAATSWMPVYIVGGIALLLIILQMNRRK